MQKERKAEGVTGVLDVERPQRHSTTSGVDQTPANKRTWTVPDEGDEGTHRGGQKHVKGDKKRGKRQRDEGTGVNAIPVG